MSEVIATMENYDLLREDWDSILELAQFTGRPETAQQISSKVSRYKYTARDTAMYQTYILAKFGLISDQEIGSATSSRIRSNSQMASPSGCGD